MELKEILMKIKNLLDIDNRRGLTDKEEKEIDRLKKLRNKLDPEWYKHVQVIFNIAYNGWVYMQCES